MARVLVIDDTQEHLLLLQMMLELKAHKVETASTKEECLAKLETFNPDIILLDVLLRNNYSGRTLCKQIKKTSPHIYIILLSADQPSLKDYKQCNADGVIEKPFE